MRWSRRQFLGGTSAALLAGCGSLPFQSRQAQQLPRIGFLAPGTREERAPLIQGLLEGLGQLGYIDGQSIVLEYRFSEGNDERLLPLAAELVAQKVDVIVASASSGTLAAKQATSTIPIVMGATSEPVATGILTSLARPGGNVTGMSLMASQLMGKRLELLGQTVPGLSLVGFFANLANPVHVPQLHELVIAARAFGAEVRKLEVRRADDFEAGFEVAAAERANAVIVPSDALSTNNRGRIASLAAKHRLPAMYDFREFVEVGGLLSYGPNLMDSYRRAAAYVDKLLKGARPADLPVQQPLIFDFAVNLKTARQLGIIFPPEILLQVTEVVE